MSNRLERRSQADPVRADANRLKDSSGGDSRKITNDFIKWRFHRTTGSQWRWQKVVAGEAVTHESARSFASYEDCIDDAASAGYKPSIPAGNLVSLSLVRDPQPIPRILGFGISEEKERPANRSTVLKKRVAHPAIERIFGKNRNPALTRKRATGHARATAAVSTSGKRGLRSHLPAKSRINRA